MRNFIKFWSIAIILIILIANVLAENSDATLLSQDFNGSWSTQNPPTGWTIIYNTPVGNSDWHRRQAQSPWSDNLTGFACLYQTPPELGDDILISPTVNCSLYTNVTLRCSTYFIPQEGSCIAKLQGSWDGGVNWLTIFDYYGQSVGPGLQVFPCPWADNKSNVKFRWYFSGNTNTIYHWSVDNVTVTADPIIFDVGVTAIIAPTGTIDSGTVVTPKAQVKNFGNVSVSFPVNFKIGTFYSAIKWTNLNPGESTVVNFANWTAIQVGTHTTKCSTALAEDAVPSNNALTDSVTVQIKDVGVLQIVVPADTMDTTGPITPQVRVKNYGTNTENFNVTLKIGNNFFIRNKTLSARMEDTVNFSIWNAVPGFYVTRCSTYLAGDYNPNNDTLSGWTVIRNRDVGVTEIVTPTGVIDSLDSITPLARVKNFGSETETFNVCFKIGESYYQVRTKTLPPGNEDTVNFPNWVPTRGTFATLCTTYLAGDRNPNNNLLSGSVTVRVRDVGVSEILVPAGILDSCSFVIPCVLVKNFGTETETFNVTFKIGTVYSQTRTKTLPSEVEDTVNFIAWIPSRGTFITRCSTYLTSDVNRNNDTITGSVTIQVLDVGVLEIIAPTGIIDSGTSITPQARLKNFGTDAVTFLVSFQIGDWIQTRSKTLEVGQSDTASFLTWTAQSPGTYLVKCTTLLSGDLVPDNNFLTDSITVRIVDVGVANIVAPTGILMPETILPKAWVKNYGSWICSAFEIKFEILPGYTDTQSVANLLPGESLLVTFAHWSDTCGRYTVKCSTMLAGDCNPNNDYKSGDIVVSLTGQNPGKWIELSNSTIPGLPLKDGSCLEVIKDTLIFLIKGNKSLEFYRFNTNRDSWTKLTFVPGGENNKVVKKGAKLVGDGNRYLYLLKGSNTLEFYRYDTEKDSWLTLPKVPLGGGKKIKEGTGLAYCQKYGQSFIYLLKGVKTREFYRFNITADSWEKMDDAPSGRIKPGFKKGSDIAYDPENQIIYCLKGQTNEMFAYDVTNDTWLAKQFNDMPLIHPLSGKKKKAKDGAALLVKTPELIYALKGGNTCEFWLFKPLETDSGKWFGLALLPENGVDGKKRRVKGGGDLVSAIYHNQSALLAIKGNKTDKIWKWTDSLLTSQESSVPNLKNSTLGDSTFRISNCELIKPNPTGTEIAINLSSLELLLSPTISNAVLRIQIYNVAGQIVLNYHQLLESGKKRILLDVRKIPAGVYLLRLTIDQKQIIRKIIVSH